MPSILRRAPPNVIALILYYGKLGVKAAAVSELIDLKIRAHKHTPAECRQRIEFAYKEDFPRKGRPWDFDGVGQEISELVDRDTFLLLTEIDSAFRTLNALKSDRNLVRVPAMAAMKKKDKAQEARRLDGERKVREMEAKERELRQKANEAMRLSRFVTYDERLAKTNPPLPRAWTENADDEVLGRGSRFTEML